MFGSSSGSCVTITAKPPALACVSNIFLTSNLPPSSKDVNGSSTSQRRASDINKRDNATRRRCPEESLRTGTSASSSISI